MKKNTINFALIFIFIVRFSYLASAASDKEISDIATKSKAGLIFSADSSLSTFNNIGSAVQSSSDERVEDQLSIVAVGDILLHQPLHEQALRSPDGHKSLWKNLMPYLSGADMTYGNLEGPVAPGVNTKGQFVPDPGNVFDQDVYSSYPRFNYHESLVTDLIDSGFDVVSTANNHALDHRSHGVDRTTETLQKHNLPYTGTRHSENLQRDMEVWPTIIERKGFRIAWLACTFSTNGTTDDLGQVLHCYHHRKRVLAMIKELSNDSRIDAVIVTPHVGKEYEDLPESSQVSLYRSFIDEGAIAILGAHPHVLQPWEKYINKKGEETFIIYSLGNFVSGQFQKVKTRASIMLNLNLTKDESGKVKVAQVRYLPLEMQRTKRGEYTVAPISSSQGNSEMYGHIKGMFGTINMIQLNQNAKKPSSNSPLP